MHAHSFERIWTKFDTWHRYTLRMVKGVSERHLIPRAPAPRAVHTLLQMSGELRREIWNQPAVRYTRENRAP